MKQTRTILILSIIGSFLLANSGCTNDKKIHSSPSYETRQKISLVSENEKKILNFEKPTEDEIMLWKLINQHRANYKIPPIPLSKSLTHVAKTHVSDLINYPPKSPCNSHSWSSYGSWSEACYTPDHANANGMWSKPRELTNYKGRGYENIAGGGGIQILPQTALRLWADDPPHNDVIINRGIWSKMNWRSLGIGIYRGYACMWLGEEEDSDGYWMK